MSFRQKSEGLLKVNKAPSCLHTGEIATGDARRDSKRDERRDSKKNHCGGVAEPGRVAWSRGPVNSVRKSGRMEWIGCGCGAHSVCRPLFIAHSAVTQSQHWRVRHGCIVEPRRAQPCTNRGVIADPSTLVEPMLQRIVAFPPSNAVTRSIRPDRTGASQSQ